AGVGALILSMCHHLGAQAEDTKTTDATDQERTAQRAFETGVRLAQDNRWEEARSAFEKAYALAPRPIVLVNLASAQAQTGDLVAAAENYRRYLGAPGESQEPEMRKQVQSYLNALVPRIPLVKIQLDGARRDVAVEVDGAAVPSEKLVRLLPLNPGDHTVIAAREGVEAARFRFVLAERE